MSYTKGLGLLFGFVVVWPSPTVEFSAQGMSLGLELPDLHGAEGWGQPSSPNPLILRL